MFAPDEVTRDPSLWPPSASIDALRQRAAIIAAIRAFFAARGVLEVDTPLLCPISATDPLLDSVPAYPFGEQARWYLQTSPEFAMKRLLAAGSGAIYQMGKAFRRAESGSRHNPEFTMLEWYRPDFETARLMREVSELCGLVLGRHDAATHSYRALFEQHLGLDPLAADIADLRRLGMEHAGAEAGQWLRDELLDLLFGTVVEPCLGHDCLQFVVDFPASRASLAQLRKDESGTIVADRFELFVNGIELANGYNELGDARELRRRMMADNAARIALGRSAIPPDERLLAALQQGLPACAGVALGIDRLVMLALDVTHIDQVIAFCADRA